MTWLYCIYNTMAVADLTTQRTQGICSHEIDKFVQNIRASAPGRLTFYDTQFPLAD